MDGSIQPVHLLVTRHLRQYWPTPPPAPTCVPDALSGGCSSGATQPSLKRSSPGTRTHTLKLPSVSNTAGSTAATTVTPTYQLDMLHLSGSSPHVCKQQDYDRTGSQC